MSSDHGPLFRLVAIASLSCAALATRTAVRAEERVPALPRATHPMDALTPDEIMASARILRAAGKLGETVRLVSLTLEENPKTEVRAWTRGKPFGRRAFAVLLDGDHLAEARLDLDARTLTAWTPVENRQAALTVAEFIAATEIPKGDERWRAAMAKRGITEFDNIVCFPLTVGPSVGPALAGRSVDQILADCAKSAAARGVTSKDRVLSSAPWTGPGDLVDGLLAVMAIGASLVQVANPDPMMLQRRVETEKVTRLL